MKKKILISTPIFLSALIALAYYLVKPNSVADSNLLVTKFDQGINRIENLKISGATSDKSGAFWLSVNNAYDWLKSINNEDRYFFLYSVVDAAGINDSKEREESLKLVIALEKDRFEDSYLAKKQKSEWLNHVGKMSKTLNDWLSGVKSNNLLISRTNISNQIAIKSLQEIRSDFLSADNSGIRNNSVNEKATLLLLIMMGIIGSIVTFLNGNKEKEHSSISIAEEKLNQPEDKIQVFNLVQNNDNKSTINLEEICRKGVDNLQYLFNTSGLRIHTGPAIPTIFGLNGNKEKFSSAVDSLIRGALVLAQNHNDQSLSMQWSCKTTEDRAYVDIEILGKEFDIDELRRNHQLLNGASIISQFARAEMQLESYRPAIKIVPKDGKTKISMSLEIEPAASATLQIQ